MTRRSARRSQTISGSLAAAIVFLLGAGICGGCGQTWSAPETPRVLLISVDTLRADFLGVYNPDRPITPNLDQFAADSVVFTNATSQAATTLISHTSIFDGLYPFTHKTTTHAVPVSTPELPFRRMLDAGMTVSAIYSPGQLNPKTLRNQPFTSSERLSKIGPRGDRHELPDLERKSFKWLKAHADQPFLLFLHTYEVHCPYTPPEPYRSRYAGWYQGTVDPRGKCGIRDYSQMRLTATDYRFLSDLYAGSVAYFDDFFGRLIEELKDLGLYDKTLIVFTSDHGESFGEHGHVGHGKLWWVDLHVPLIIRFPGLEPNRVDRPVETVDIMPTLFAALGLEAPYRFQGRSLLPDLLGENDSPGKERFRIAEGRRQVAITSGPWMLTTTKEGEQAPVLWNHDSDPEEKEDVARRNPARVRRMLQVYFSQVADARALTAKFVLDSGEPMQFDQETTEQLRALGYIN